MGKTAEQYLRS